MEKQHLVITKDYPQNQKHGLMICGINFGFSAADKAADDRGDSGESEEKGYFSDPHINQTDFRNRIVAAFSLWGQPLQVEEQSIGNYEKAIFQTNWLCSQTNNAEGLGTAALVAGGADVINLIIQRQPKLILFFGRNLIEAFNDSSFRPRLEVGLGPRSGNGYRLNLAQKGEKGFEVVFQSYGDTQIICFPHITGAYGLSDKFIARYRLSIGGAIQKWRGLYVADESKALA